MNYLPEWFQCVNVLPFWLLTFREVSPPEWALEESIPEWLMRGEIPCWIEGENNFANVDKWLEFDQLPEWIMKGTYPSWMENVTKTKESGPVEFLKQGLVRYAVLYGDMLVPLDFVVPHDDRYCLYIYLYYKSLYLYQVINMYVNHVYVYIYIYLCICICIYMNIYVTYICMYIYIVDRGFYGI
jgi:hypothetical protein